MSIMDEVYAQVLAMLAEDERSSAPAERALVLAAYEYDALVEEIYTELGEPLVSVGNIMLGGIRIDRFPPAAQPHGTVERYRTVRL